jgi:hypothetical protein
MKSIKRSLSSRLIALLAGAALFGVITQSALAAGTPSGTTISNIATLSYAVGGVTQTAVASGAASFVVDKKVDVLVTAMDVATISVSPGQFAAVTTFTVTNNGNDTQDFGLVAGDVANGQVVLTKTDNFNVTSGSIQIFVESGATAGFQSAQDTATYIDELAPGASKTVYVLANIPLAQVSGDVAAVYLKATAEVGGSTATQGAALVATVGPNTGGVDIVFADAAGTDDSTGARDGQHSARDAYLVSSSVLTVTKAVALICDPINGNAANRMNIPGAAVQYAVTITNAAGAASATLAQISDVLDVARLTFDPKLNSGSLPAANCVSGNVANTFSASGFGAVSGTGTTVTTYAAPGLAAQAVTAGAAFATPNVTIDFTTLAGAGYGLVGGVLPANSFVTVYFNAFVQ